MSRWQKTPQRKVIVDMELTIISIPVTSREAHKGLVVTPTNVINSHQLSRAITSELHFLNYIGRIIMLVGSYYIDGC